MITNEEYKNAFINASDARIAFILEDQYWDYLVEGSENICGYKSLWENFCKMLKEDFNDDINLYNNEFYKLKRKFKSLGKYMERNMPNITKEMYNAELFDFVSHKNDLGKLMYDGHYYLSIDLKDAAFQFLDYFNCIPNKTFDEFVKEITDYSQILCFRGNKLKCWNEITLCVGDQMQRRMGMAVLSKIYENSHPLIKYIKEKGLKIAEIRTDEILFYVGETNDLSEEFVNEFCGKDVEIGGFMCHINLFKYGLIHYKINDNEMYKAFFDNVITGKRKFNAKNCLYMWQLNKLFNGEELNELDKMIRNGSSYIKFNDKIEIIKG